MIDVSTDNNLIYSVLEKANKLPTRFDLDHVFAFDVEDFFYVIIYLANNRNFICFSVGDFLLDSNKLIYMQQVVESYSEKEISLKLAEEALQLIEHKMHTKNNTTYFFDAH